MKFQPDHADGVNLISRFEDRPRPRQCRRVRIERARALARRRAALDASMHLPSSRPRTSTRLLELKPEIVIFGSGARLRFVQAGVAAAA